MTPSVQMKAGMRNAVIITPEKAPNRPHNPRPPTQQQIMPMAVASVAPPQCSIIHAVITAAKAIRLPTERSMPAVMMTSVIPMAMMAV